MYGGALGISHNLMLDSAFDVPPGLGGNLEGKLPAPVEMGIVRFGVMVSSIFTGCVVGFISGLLAQLLSTLRGRHADRTAGKRPERSLPGRTGVESDAAAPASQDDADR